MRPLGETAAGAILGAGFLTPSAIRASAAIACAGRVCWHTHETYAYPRESRVVVPRTIGAGGREGFTFREHEGRGYWRGRNWVTW
ncbi:hypothetical protein ACVI1L_006118 [Bradyrhizobium sp. USDA 4516]|uniref:hypothetical protein n=1 Tax=Bradyrhizobium TaxID=374 RepID=UPI000A6CFFE6|nr:MULTISPECIES: hypothetical protein [Bradyrhizobium]